MGVFILESSPFQVIYRWRMDLYETFVDSCATDFLIPSFHFDVRLPGVFAGFPLHPSLNTARTPRISDNFSSTYAYLYQNLSTRGRTDGSVEKVFRMHDIPEL